MEFLVPSLTIISYLSGWPETQSDAHAMEFLVPSLTIVFGLILLVLALPRPKRPQLPYPPGPPPKPLIGNALDIPSEKPWITYRNWTEEFNSDMIHLTAMNQHIVILNKIKDAKMLFEKRSQIYSSRPSVPVVDILGAGRGTPLLAYGDEWRKHRKFYQESIRKDLVSLYADSYTEKVHLLLGQLLSSPEKLMKHSKWFTASNTMAMTFGYEYPPDKEHDHFVELAEETINGISSLFLPGSTLINVFPFLKHIPPWVPGATTQRFAAKIKKAINLYRSEPFEYVEREMAAATAKPSMLGRILQRREKTNGMYEDEEVLKDMVMTTYLAGVETLQSSVMTFFMAMALYPAVQKRAQEEIDRVVGGDRLPNFEDRASLPYVDAVLRETLRWWCVVPLGMPHTTTSDDVYNGFYFPKGTTVIANTWAMMRDEEIYPDPDSFRPERFFNDDGTLNNDTAQYVFGFGRRACPGRYVADSVLWMMIACVLSTFNIAKARDEKGREIEIDRDAFTDSVISMPRPFDCSITCRSSEAASLIHDTIALQLNP